MGIELNIWETPGRGPRFGFENIYYIYIIHVVLIIVVIIFCLFALFLGMTPYCAHLGRWRRPAKHGGFNVLDRRRISLGDAGKLGNFATLAALPDN